MGGAKRALLGSVTQYRCWYCDEPVYNEDGAPHPQCEENYKREREREQLRAELRADKLKGG